MLGALRRHKLPGLWGWVGRREAARSPLHSAQSQVFLLRPPRHPKVSGCYMLTFLSRLGFISVRPGSGTSGTW